MKHSIKFSPLLAAALTAFLASGSALAQTASGTSGSASTGTAASGSSASRSSMMGGGFSMMAPGSSYVGFNFGQSTFRLNNGAGGFPSDQTKNSYSLYGGSYFSEFLGAQIGYTDFDRVTRAGGTSYANGLSLSLVGRLPVATSVNLLGRLGTTYSRSNVSSSPASGVTPGSESGWGLSYGVGAEYMFSPNWSTVLQYDEYRVKFSGTGREKINALGLGVRYNF